MDEINPNKFCRIFYDDSFLADLGKYLNTKEQGNNNLANYLTEKKFTIKDTDSTYRVINHWSSLGLFDDSRFENKGWRKFSLVDMVWLKVLIELRKFGLSLDKLKISYESIKSKTAIFEFSILSCLMRNAMYVIVFSDGHTEIAPRNAVSFSEAGSYLNETSYLTVNLNCCLERIFPGKSYSDQLCAFELSKQETRILEELRLKQPEKITVKMKNGSPDLLITKTKYKKDVDTENNLKVSYGNVTTHVADNHVMYFEKTEKTKL